jgi:hypothetical protein
MLISLSETTLRNANSSIIALLLLSGVLFHVLQNRLNLIGGAIALAKLLWLGLAILLWLGLPLLLALDGRLSPWLRYAFAFLFVSMAARGIIELWMLYVSKNWSPNYGIAHDLLCMAGLLLCLGLAWQAGEINRHPRMALHGLITTLLFIPEIYFAWYMRRNFHTKGGDAIYFVPDEAKHRRVLRITASVDMMLLLYLPVFLYYWCYV